MKSLLKEFIGGFKQMRRDKFDYFFFFFQLLIVFGVIKQLGTDLFLVINLLLIFILLNVKKRFHIGSFFFILSFIYFIIILLPIFSFGFNSKLYIGFYIRLISAYFLALYFREKFIIMYENLIFVLACISIPLFLIQIIDVTFYDVFDPITNALLFDNLLDDPSPVGFKYLVVFLVNPGGLLRNSGFAWEPAAFGGSLAWAILFNLYLNKFNLNRRLFILFFTSLTTFSVGTFAYLGVLLLLFLYERRELKALYLFILMVILMITLIRVPFINNQIQAMYTKVENEPENIERSLAGEVKPTSVSRIAGFYVNISYFIKRPLGYGFAERSPALSMLGSSPNGLMHILVRWGIIGIISFVYASYKLMLLLKHMFYGKVKKISLLLSLCLFIMPFTGNPFYNEPLLFAMLILPFILNYQSKFIYTAYATDYSKNTPKRRF